MKQRTRLITAKAICQCCEEEKALVLFRNRTWCLVDVINEVLAHRGALQTRIRQKAS
jgi:hypothetical protein